MWLNQLKIAVLQKDFEKINSLLDDMPTLSNPKDLETAAYLLAEASSLAKVLKADTAASMKQMKKSINFLNSTQAPITGSLDIKS